MIGVSRAGGRPSARRVSRKSVELTRERVQRRVRVHEPRVAEPGRAPHADVGVGRQPDRRAGPLQRGHRDPHARAAGKVLALIVDRLAAPQALERRQPLLEATDSLARVHAHRLVLGVAIAETHADDQPPAADHVERGELLGEVDRLVQREQQHAGAELHALGLGGHAPERRQRLEVRERVGEIVLTRPDGRESDTRGPGAPARRARRSGRPASLPGGAGPRARGRVAWVGGIYAARHGRVKRARRARGRVTLVCLPVR